MLRRMINENENENENDQLVFLFTYKTFVVSFENSNIVSFDFSRT